MKIRIKEIIMTAILIPVLSTTPATVAEGKARNEGDILHQNESYTLFRDRIVEGEDVARAYLAGRWLGVKNARLEMVRPFLRNPRPTLKTDRIPIWESMFHIALCDFEMNYMGGHFRVTPDFHPDMFFTRDIAYSSMLGANFAFAEEIKTHLRATRVLRRNVGFKTIPGHRIRIESVTPLEELLPMTNLTFFEKFNTHAFARRTDDICWVPGYWDAMKVRLDEGELEWFVSEFEYFDTTFYRHMLDEDGLYFGQATFIDIGGTGYPDHFTPEDSIMIKATSTNAVYYRAFKIMEEAYTLLGREEDAALMGARAERLKSAILDGLRLEDGHFAYFKHLDGTLEPRREQLGSAFPVLFGIVEGEDTAAGVGNAPGNDFGNPLLWPFYPGTRVYHNNSIWPFANTFFNLAEYKATPDDAHILRTLANLTRHALQGNFAELFDYETGGGRFKHARSYTWSAAAYMALPFHFILGMDVHQFKTLSFDPHFPAVLGASLQVENLRIQGTTVHVELRGNGRQVTSVTLNGNPVERAALPLDGGNHHIIINLN